MSSERNQPLVCQSLVVGYDGRGLLPPIDLTLDPASFWAVVGRNGAGKSTWMRTALGLLPPVSGRIRRPAGMRLAFVPQRLNLDPIVPVRATDVVAMGAEHGTSFLRPRPKVLHRKIAAALEEVGAGALGDHPFRDLSEGQKQKVLLARCIVGEPDVVFLDEPTAAMDVVAEREVLELIDGLRKRHGTTVVIVAHYLPLVADLAEEVLFLDRETEAVVSGRPGTVFESEAFRRRYGDVAVGLVNEAST
jgi:zinc transport system ATP-binding protein